MSAVPVEAEVLEEQEVLVVPAEAVELKVVAGLAVLVEAAEQAVQVVPEAVVVPAEAVELEVVAGLAVLVEAAEQAVQVVPEEQVEAEERAAPAHSAVMK